MCLKYFVGFMGFVQIVTSAYSPEKETEIRRETVLAASYDALSRPKSQSEVKVGLHLLAIDALELKTQKFSAAGWLTFEWLDERLMWDKTAKDDIEYIYCLPSAIWKPEVIIDNSLKSLGVIADKNLLLKIDYDGTVEWEPPLLFTTHCENIGLSSYTHHCLDPYTGSWSRPRSLVRSFGQPCCRKRADNNSKASFIRNWPRYESKQNVPSIDITYYPYDKQSCGIEIVSWGYTYDAIKLTHLTPNVNLEDFERHGEWVITETRLEDKNLTEHNSHGTLLVYPQLVFRITMERRTEFYSLNVMMPIFLMSVLIVLVFIVPINSGEKLSFVLTVLLSLSVLMTVVAETLPPTSVTTSVLGVYLGVVLVLAGVAVLLTVLILILFHQNGGPKQRSFAMRIYRCMETITFNKSSFSSGQRTNVIQVAPVDGTNTTKLTPIDGINKLKLAPVEDIPVEPENDNMENDSVRDLICTDVNWQDLAVMIDKFCFVAFTILTLVTNISFQLALTGNVHIPYYG